MLVVSGVGPLPLAAATELLFLSPLQLLSRTEQVSSQVHFVRVFCPVLGIPKRKALVIDVLLCDNLSTWKEETH